MLGYFNDQPRTNKVLADGWLRTGDLAYWDSTGMLCVQGRMDDMIVRAGMNVYPVEIENVLSKNPMVKEVLVYGYEKNGTREIGMKICGDFSDIDDVTELCHHMLPPFQMPTKIELLEDSNLLSGGKKKRSCGVPEAQIKVNPVCLDPGMGYEEYLLWRSMDVKKQAESYDKAIERSFSDAVELARKQKKI
jgi:acyl-CoA synthetase (AMP-forming)/AMP-acid ligase II